MAHEVSHWAANALPDLTGQTYVVAGPTSGIGFETAQALAGKHATVVMIGRNAARLAAAQARIETSLEGAASLYSYGADMASLDQVHAVADQIAERHPGIDGLVLNAGVLQPKETETHDGYEVHMGVNFLAPALLAGKLLNSMRNAPSASIVYVGSSGERFARGDIDLKRQDALRANAYNNSKKAAHGFFRAFDRELVEHGYSVRTVVAAPGITRTELFDQPGFLPHMFGVFARRPAHVGARPILRAATDPSIPAGSYVGLNLLRQLVQKKSAGEVQQPAFQRRMWRMALSEIEVVLPWASR